MDLVCIDPPFAKNDTFTADKLKPPLTRQERDNELRLLKGWGIATQEQADAAGLAWPDDPKARGGYRDTWAWDTDVHEDWITGIETTHPAVSKLLDATRHIHGEDTAAYLCFMAIRLIEIHRILKPTGSLYLHCDHSANSYLRQLLDGVFGRDNLRNEIVWGYKASNTPIKKSFPHKHDNILFYARGEDNTFTPQYTPYNEEYVSAMYKRDESGRLYRHRGYRKDGSPRINYLDEGKGTAVLSWWTDILGFGTATQAKERTGYPTQKPIALAERIIQASTNPGDVVLDCFAGCAYTAVAAEKLGRRWAACDINPRAWTVFKRQFNKGGDLPLLTCNDQITGQQVMGSEPTVTIHGPQELPMRTTSAEVEIKPLRTDNRRQERRQYKRESTLLDKREMLTALLQFSNGKAWCCGFASENADGGLAYGDYELDHIVPKSKGGEDDIVNRAPLCSTHNQLKSAHDINLQELRTLVAERREFKAGITSMALPKLAEAYEYALRVRQRAYQRKFGRALGV